MPNSLANSNNNSPNSNITHTVEGIKNIIVFLLSNRNGSGKWENKKCCGKISQQKSVYTAFLSYPKLAQVFLYLKTKHIEHDFYFFQKI